MAEFPTLGNTCWVKTCKQLDFLPFTCAFCKKVFCLDHRTPDSHDCDISTVTNRTKTPEDVIYYNCSYIGCEGREAVPVTCSLCENNFCMRHRLSEDHKCTKLRPTTSYSKAVKAPEVVVKQLSVNHTFRNQKNEETMKRVILMKLKMKAVGDSGIPQTERMYFNITLPNVKDRTTPKIQPYFFSNQWTIGKIVDFIATKEKIPNFNNVATAKKLQLILTKDQSILPFDKTLSVLRDNGLEDGSDLKLE